MRAFSYLRLETMVACTVRVLSQEIIEGQWFVGNSRSQTSQKCISRHLDVQLLHWLMNHDDFDEFLINNRIVPWSQFGCRPIFDH